MSKYQYISFRAPKELVDAIDQLARRESDRTGLPVDRSGIVRRAIEEDLKRRPATIPEHQIEAAQVLIDQQAAQALTKEGGAA